MRKRLVKKLLLTNRLPSQTRWFQVWYSHRKSFDVGANTSFQPYVTHHFPLFLFPFFFFFFYSLSRFSLPPTPPFFVFFIICFEICFRLWFHSKRNCLVWWGFSFVVSSDSLCVFSFKYHWYLLDINGNFLGFRQYFYTTASIFNTLWYFFFFLIKNWICSFFMFFFRLLKFFRYFCLLFLLLRVFTWITL